MDESILKKRTDWKKAEYLPKIGVPAFGHQIVEALRGAVPILNIASEAAVRYGIKQPKYKIGHAEFVTVTVGGCRGVFVGTTGDYPVANMVLVVASGEGEPIVLDRIYPAGTAFCIVHCEWAHVGWKHKLPLAGGFYMSVRRTFAGCFEQCLVQMGIDI